MVDKKGKREETKRKKTGKRKREGGDRDHK